MSAVNALSSATPVQPPPKPAPVEAGNAIRAGKDAKNDGDADDGVKAAQASAPKPVTNTLGQVLGQHVNVKG